MERGEGSNGDGGQLDLEYQLFYDISQGIATATTVTEGLRTVLSEVCALTEWAYGEVWIPGDDQSLLVHDSLYALESDFDEFERISQQTTFERDEGLPGRVWASRDVEWIDDVSALSAEEYLRTDAAEQANLKAAYGVPIETEERLEAVLVFYLTEERPVDSRLSRIVETIAANLGTFVARKRAEEALRSERSILRRLFDTNPVGVMVVDRTGAITRSNARAAEIFGVPNSNLISGDYTEPGATLLDSRDEPVPEEKHPISQVFETGDEMHDEQLRVERQDGSTLWISINAAPLFDGHGEIERVVAAFEDVTERTERERELSAFRRAVEQAGRAIYIMDSEGTITYANDRLESLSGYELTEIVGSTPELLLADENDFDDALETVQSGDIWTGEVVNHRKSGEELVVSRTITPISDSIGDINRLVGVDTDISDQKERERSVRHHRDSLDRAKRVLETLAGIHGPMLGATDINDLLDSVCEYLGNSSVYADAWCGRVHTEDTVTVTATATVDVDLVEERLGEPESDIHTMILRAIETSDVQINRRVPGNDTDDEAFTPVDPSNTSIAVVPISYGEAVDSVLCLYSSRSTAFEGTERSLLSDLGARIGADAYALAIEELLQTGGRIELEFEAGESDVLAVASDELDCTLDVTRVIPEGDGFVHYLVVDGASLRSVEQRLAAKGAITSVTVLDAGDRSRLRCTISSGSLSVALGERGVKVSAGSFRHGTGRVVSEVTTETDVRKLLEQIRRVIPDTELVARRTIDKASSNDEEDDQAHEREPLDTLTNRQQDVLELAYRSGYYDSPRKTSGEDLAEELDISSATFYQHLRRAHQNLVDIAFRTELDSERDNRGGRSETK